MQQQNEAQLNVVKDDLEGVLDRAEEYMRNYQSCLIKINPESQFETDQIKASLNYSYTAAKSCFEVAQKTIEEMMQAFKPDSEQLKRFEQIFKRKESLDVFLAKYSQHNDEKERKSASQNLLNQDPIVRVKARTAKQSLQELIFEKSYFELYSLGTKIEKLHEMAPTLANGRILVNKEKQREKFIKFFELCDLVRVNFEVMKRCHAEPGEFVLHEDAEKYAIKLFKSAIPRWKKCFPGELLPICATAEERERKFLKSVFTEEFLNVFEEHGVFKKDKLVPASVSQTDHSDEKKSRPRTRLPSIKEEEFDASASSSQVRVSDDKSPSLKTRLQDTELESGNFTNQTSLLNNKKGALGSYGYSKGQTFHESPVTIHLKKHGPGKPPDKPDKSGKPELRQPVEESTSTLSHS